MIDNNTWHLASCTIALLERMEANGLVNIRDASGRADERPDQRAYQNAIVALAKVGREYPPKNPHLRPNVRRYGKCKTCGHGMWSDRLECPNCRVSGPRTGGHPPMVFEHE